MKSKKITVIILFIIIAGFVLYSVFNISDSGLITPYVPFETAMISENNVQIIGKLSNSIPIIHKKDFFTFSLIDKDDSVMSIIFNGVKPANFEKADQIVVQGVYKKNKAVFEAKKILVKCPSKYKKSN